MDSSERRTLIVMTNGIGMKSQDCLAFAVRHLLRSNDALILLHFDMAQKTTEYKHVGVMSDEAAALDEKMRVLKNRSATEHIQSLVEFCASNNVGEHASASAVSAPPLFFSRLVLHLSLADSGRSARKKNGGLEPSHSRPGLLASSYCGDRLVAQVGDGAVGGACTAE